MRSHEAGPRRSGSADSLVRSTRLLALFALLALAGGIVADSTDESFWSRHALLAGLVSSLIVVMLSLALINEVVELRRRERWRVLAQIVMLELVRNARLVWTGVLTQVGLLDRDAERPDAVDANGRIARDTPRLSTAVGKAVADDNGRRALRDEFSLFTVHCDEVLGRWAGVMLNAALYAEVIDRHVELASDVNWLSNLLDNSDPPDDRRRHRRATGSPAVQVTGQFEGDELAQRIVVVTQLAEVLDRSTLELAFRIVPLTWWQSRLRSGMTPA